LPTTQSEPAGRYVVMDAMRGVAALFVVLHHVGIAAKHEELFSQGSLAVDLFFALSGFVISAAYHRRLAAAQAPVMEMLKIRLKRLYPMMALGVCLGALTLSFHAPGASAGEAIVKGLLFWPTLTPHHDLFVADSVEWSLMMELGVNVVHAAVLWRLRLPALIAIAGVSLVALIATTVADGQVSSGWSSDNLAGGIARVCFSYVTGMVLFRLRAAPLRLNLSPALVVAAVPAGILLAGIPSCELFGGLDCVIVLFPILVFAASKLDLTGAGRLLATKAGDISYPFYAIHFPLLVTFKQFVAPQLHGPIAQTLGWAAFIGAAGVAAWLALVLIDQPIRAALSRSAGIRASLRATNA